MSGTLVISLDFELYWGVRDSRSLESYRENLLGVRSAVPRLLDLFRDYEIHATWATVGFLFCETKEELVESLPDRRPAYSNPRLSPYPHIAELGPDEERDPFHYAPSLVGRIAAAPGQEVGSHTFSHYYCLEQGQGPGDFEADLRAAVAVADRRGIELESLVLPRNQVRPDYLPICRQLGFVTYRGTERSWIYAARARASESRWRRGLRLIDAYANVTSHNLFAPDLSGEPPHCVPSSRFLRPYDSRLRALESLRLRRILRSLDVAAEHGLAYHLWWHPHNFGVQIDQNLGLLERILERFARLRETHGMRSLAMREVAAQGAEVKSRA
jgi:hypothetical protein